MDDWFLADLTLIWHANPVYTNIHWYHYIAESRYNGGEVVTIAPDYSPSAIHADYHLPVRIGTDAALALAMCKVIIDAGLYQKRFVQEQTDLPLLVRKDNGRFLRGCDVAEGGREDQFYWWNTLTRAGGPVLLVEHADERAYAGAAGNARPRWNRSRPGRKLRGHPERRERCPGGARLREAVPPPRGLHAGEGGSDLRDPP
jgi:anaerobic selenocysteine-containing dehydrogenase